ncbi:hypothetical protein [Umezawaea beigongshangensis]|uniref:hypothetical protein n=1 Tax=Umezawaea beigongshangensis TaxID=2780383 RepID=UPI0018F1E436|nr:hypothetical protein [Umezawaea beigongshangensis]
MVIPSPAGIAEVTSPVNSCARTTAPVVVSTAFTVVTPKSTTPDRVSTAVSPVPQPGLW